MILFFKVFLTEFIAEMGDKTQLMLIALTSKYKLRDIILGTAAAILVLNGLAVLADGASRESRRRGRQRIHSRLAHQGHCRTCISVFCRINTRG